MQVDATGRINEFNPHAAATTGFSREAVLGMDPCEVERLSARSMQ